MRLDSDVGAGSGIGAYRFGLVMIKMSKIYKGHNNRKQNGKN